MAQLLPTIRANIQEETAIMSDEAVWYQTLGTQVWRLEDVDVLALFECG
ncbi:hypothetical protein [Bradyrhizobium sp. Leo121]|jgi:hypothetical protein|nr:hypothetical protein [Bradyrhizobium sp. Leo121]